MGTTTPNIGIYIPSAGETNYSDAFASGMINLDQHDHTGGPNKGLPITSTGLADFSVTFNKLASNVADVTTGIGVDSSPGNMNRLQILGILRNLFNLATANGFLGKNGANVVARTFQDTATVKWTHGDGTVADPVANVDIGGLSPIGVANGGTGVTTLNTFDILLGGTTSTGPIQQVVGEGTLNQYLASQGAGMKPAWQTLPTPAAQNLQIATLSLNAAQFTAITSSGSTNVVLVPAQGDGTVVVVNSAWGKVTVGADRFHSGSSVHLYWGSSSTDVGFNWTSGSFTDTSSGYYYPDRTLTSSSTVIPSSTMENRNVTIGINSSSFTGGTGSTATFWCSYSVMTI